MAFSIKRYVLWQLCTGKVKYKLETYCGMSCVKKKQTNKKKTKPHSDKYRKAKKGNPYYCKVWFLVKWKRTSCALWWTSSHFLHLLPKSITEVRGQRSEEVELHADQQHSSVWRGWVGGCEAGRRGTQQPTHWRSYTVARGDDALPRWRSLACFSQYMVSPNQKWPLIMRLRPQSVQV